MAAVRVLRFSCEFLLMIRQRSITLDSNRVTEHLSILCEVTAQLDIRRNHHLLRVRPESLFDALTVRTTL